MVKSQTMVKIGGNVATQVITLSAPLRGLIRPSPELTLVLNEPTAQAVALITSGWVDQIMPRVARNVQQRRRNTRRSSAMQRPFVPVTTQAEVDQLFAASADHPVIIFKHDFKCSISRVAEGEMQELDHDVALIDVEADKALASDVAERTGVKHESPQVIVLRNGTAAWSASHFDITSEAVAAAVGGSDASGEA